MKSNHINILAVETSTTACSVALLYQGKLTSQSELSPRKHHQLLLSMISALLKEENISLSELDALAFGSGPGSFTGLRIGAGVIQGLAIATTLPVLAISSFQALAQLCYRRWSHTQIMIATDAQLSQFYFGQYRLDKHFIMRDLCKDLLINANRLALPERSQWFLVGQAWSKFDQYTVLHQDHVTGVMLNCVPSAMDIAMLAAEKLKQFPRQSSIENMPNYLRQENAWQRWYKNKS